MQIERIAELLKPFLATSLSEAQLRHISIYIDILMKWNSRMNLTAVRQPDELVTRHFGESLFAAEQLFPTSSGEGLRVVDVGSGAGFPGLPLVIWHPELAISLIESNHKKATFLREVVRTLALPHVKVFAGRAEDLAGDLADLVTMRAVERFESALPVSARLLAPGGRLALLIGRDQTAIAKHLLPGFEWEAPVIIPGSAARVLSVGWRGRREPTS